MSRLWLFLGVLGLAGLPALAQPPYVAVPDVAPDRPAGGTTFLPWQIVQNNGGVYGVAASLPPNTPVDALHRLGTRKWLLSVFTRVIFETRATIPSVSLRLWMK